MEGYIMKKDEIIELSDGQTATIITGDESSILNNSYIVKLENGEVRVVDRKTLTLAATK
ncbi:hypothetical protein RU92_GL001076 [Lactococcus cremoris subsp. tructae]|jgi:hypothetical protein|nr:hypothetical protein RU92_GL001076 [Lactococcus cremoris subsp. tructae]